MRGVRLLQFSWFTVMTIKFKRAKNTLDPYQADWPLREFYTHESAATRVQLATLRKLVKNNSGESALDKFIKSNPAVLTMALKYVSTGHGGAWVLPQQTIKTRMNSSDKGLIPDYIIGGLNSDGFSWWVVELKGADSQMFSKRNGSLYFSQTLNKAICQTLEYIDYCSRIQATLRDEFKLTNFREPKGLILIGREDELASDFQKQALRACWNRMNNKIEIRTFDSLVRTFEDSYRFWSANRRQGKELLKLVHEKGRNPQ